MPSLRSDFTEVDGFFPGEDKAAEWRMKDEDGVDILDLTSREFTLYLLEHPRDPLSDAKLTVTWGAGMSVSVAPFVRATFSPSLTADLPPFGYFYRMLRTDTGNVRTVAYGRMPFITGDDEQGHLR